MNELISPELIEMVVPMVAGGFTAYHGIKIGLFVLGKFMEKRAAKKQQEVENENTQERRRLGRLLDIVRGVAGALGQEVPVVEEPTQPSTEEPEDDPAEKVDLEEIIAKVISSIQKK